MTSRAEITARFAKAYVKASKKAKCQILDQVVEVTGWSRDNARRRLTAAAKRPPGLGRGAKRPRKPRSPKYSYDTLKVLQKVWAASGGQCGKYLAASMAVQLDGLERHGELVFGRDRYSPGVRAKGMRELVRVELAQPLDTDGLHLGRPPAQAPTRTAQIIAPQGTWVNPLFNFVARKIAAFPLSAAFGAMYFPGMKAFWQGEIPMLDGEVPAANGVCTARALARVYGAIANGGQLDGTRFLSPELVSGLTGRPSLRPDHNLFLPLAWHMGYHAVPIPGVLPGFGHAGLGGSIGWADPASGIAFGFVHNRLLTPMIFDQATFIGLGTLLRRGAATARRHGYHIVPDLGASYPKPAGVVAG